MDFSIPCLEVADEEDGSGLRKVTAIGYKGNTLKPDVRLNDLKIQFVSHLSLTAFPFQTLIC